ncbi:diguanylate cyclase (GGDEF)-like protein [Nocardia pseudobrasiliensis]|uniref:Diguanylate cyclase (GGDEF)-like protein n=2 Tax=Nocardia pseudobrasiliensis TaxID=45979 RepID=A0A370HPT6_9NOCA|nr:diguanylate cyclase (GGDEF)-like protein [Nocardia pseudobrasiliensis]
MWWRDRGEYDCVLTTLRSHGALGRVKFLLGSAGLVMGTLCVLTVLIHGEVMARAALTQAWIEAAAAVVWTMRWWAAWPRRAESLAWVALFDADSVANDTLVYNRVFSVLGVFLLVAMAAYVTVFHGSRVLMLHIGWSLLAAAGLALQLLRGVLPADGQGVRGRTDATIGIALVLVIILVIGIMMPLIQFCHWLMRVDSRSDPLTKLLNRRGLDAQLLRLPGGSGPRYVATLDLDRFKAVNDSFGHSFGDEVLTRTARRLAASADAGALVARTGGEEFVVIGHLREDAVTTAERLRSAIETVDVPPIAITASVGLVQLQAGRPFTESTYRDLLRLSDSLMYQAKALGGNTIAVSYLDDERVGCDRAEFGG